MKNKEASFDEIMDALDEYEEKYSNHSFENIDVFIPNVTSTNKQEEKSKSSYQIIDNNTVKMSNKTFNQKQLKTYSLIFLIVSIMFFLLGILVLPSIIFGFIMLYPHFLYKKIYKEMKEYK